MARIRSHGSFVRESSSSYSTQGIYKTLAKSSVGVRRQKCDKKPPSVSQTRHHTRRMKETQHLTQVKKKGGICSSELHFAFLFRTMAIPASLFKLYGDFFGCTCFSVAFFERIILPTQLESPPLHQMGAAAAEKEIHFSLCPNLLPRKK